MARPDFFDIGPRRSVEVDTEDGQTIVEVSEGDPNLESRVADGVDFGGEYYFQSYDGFASAAIFYRRIQNEHFRELIPSISGAEGTTPLPGVPDGELVETSIVRDDSTAEVSGLELNFLMNNFDFLPEPWNNFGVNANYTYTTAKWRLPQSNGIVRELDSLRSQPDHLGNVKLRFRWRDLGIDLSVAYRGEYSTGRFGINPSEDVFIEDLTRVTFASFYKITDGFSVHFDIRDLNKPKYVEVTGQDRNLIRRVIESEPAYWFALKYKL